LQCLVGGDSRQNPAQRRDRGLHFFQCRGILVGAGNLIDFVGEAADGFLKAHKAFRRGERMQRVADLGQAPLYTGELRRIGSRMPALVDAVGKRPNLSLKRLDGAARHGFCQCTADLAQILAQGRDRFVQPAGAIKRLHLSRDLLQLLFQPGKLRSEGGGRGRRLLRVSFLCRCVGLAVEHLLTQ